ncbi:MAG: hypothetical protein GXO71_04455 [Caldiserica bacterium]|nr:hypothetical protein [Caldisericota bacterium]
MSLWKSVFPTFSKWLGDEPTREEKARAEKIDKALDNVIRRVFILIADSLFIAAAIGIFIVNPLLFPLSLILVGLSVLLFVWGG